ncbi:ribosome recycling factor [Candidatus Kaiserbacteria bacterium]|nr:ribosome recycling factor [Candidatus Kaiserbacteria bacterium]
MMFNFKEFDERATDVVEWLTREFSAVRTGRATPALLDSVKVDSYGSKMPINQVGSVGTEDARTLRVSVWDASNVHAVEQAIVDADLGVSVVVDGGGIRVIFPELTSERRIQLLKVAKAKLEEARVSLRSARDDAGKEMDAEQKSGTMSEDERFAGKEQLQKRIDEKNKALDALYERKEKEINE